MSGSAIISPYLIDTTLLQDGQPQGAIIPADVRQAFDSVSCIFSSTQTGNYTLALSDRGTRIRYSSSSAGTFTIAPNATVGFVLNTIIQFCQVGTGQLTIAAGAGVTLLNTSSFTTRTQNSTIWIIQDQIDTWILGGDLT
jgi:hypothetical protein